MSSDILNREVKVFEIGKAGNQPFPINGERVSAKHARVTIDEAGRWILEDLCSTNGTYIYDDAGQLVRVGRKEIQEFTRIVLSDTTPMGASFYAHHLLEDNINDYRAEFRFLLEKAGRLYAERRLLKKRIKERRMLSNLIPGTVSCLLGLVVRIFFPDEMMLLIGSMSVMTTVLSLLVAWINNRDERLQELSYRIQNLLACPKCGRPLSEYDLNNQLCPACKSHA